MEILPVDLVQSICTPHATQYRSKTNRFDRQTHANPGHSRQQIRQTAKRANPVDQLKLSYRAPRFYPPQGPARDTADDSAAAHDPAHHDPAHDYAGLRAAA
jgi:hypothetical protein